MRNFSLLILFGLLMTGFISCDTGDYYEIYEEDTIEATQNDSKYIDDEFSKITNEEDDENEELKKEKPTIE